MIKINLLYNAGSSGEGTLTRIGLDQANWKLIAVAAFFYFSVNWGLDKYSRIGIASQMAELKDIEEKVSKVRGYLDKHKKTKETLQKYNSDIKRLSNMIDQVENLLKEQKNPVSLLESIARNIPNDMWLTELIIAEDDSIMIKGGSKSYKLINKFVEDLNKMPYFDGPLMIGNSNTVGGGPNNKGDRYEAFEMRGKISLLSSWGG